MLGKDQNYFKGFKTIETLPFEDLEIEFTEVTPPASVLNIYLW